MFQLSLVEHIHLSFESIAAAYDGHNQAAARLARRLWYARIGTIALVALTAVLAASSLDLGRTFHIAVAASATTALAACAAYVAFDPSPRIYGHRAAAARLWLLCENYRALIAEMHDDLIDLPGIRARRETLAREAAAVFEQAPPNDRESYEIARKALGRTADAQERIEPPALSTPAA